MVKKVSIHYPFATKQGKKLLDLLKKEGPMLHNYIIKELKRKEKGFSESSLNELLNGYVEKGWIFKVEIDGKPWYFINDFPQNVRMVIAALEAYGKSDPTVELLCQKLKENLLRLKGKPLDVIFKFTIGELLVELQDDPVLKEFWQKLKCAHAEE